MVDSNRDASATSCRDEFGGFLNGFWSGVFGLMFARCSSGHIDSCTCRAELDGDASPSAARRARD
jgi:hypothetical protein